MSEGKLIDAEVDGRMRALGIDLVIRGLGREGGGGEGEGRDGGDGGAQ